MSALRATGSTRRWRQLRQLVLARDGHRCQLPLLDASGGRLMLCGAYATHVDHVVPRVHGGTDDPANLRASCAACNLRRGQGPVRVVEAPRHGWRW